MSRAPAITRPFTDAAHDHEKCIADALAAALAFCRQEKLRLTPLRRRVLELVWQSHKPVGAYDLLELMRTDRARVAPPTVYRALDFLVSHGLVHRIDSLNAFTGCTYAGASHKAYFLICERCGTIAEIDDRGLGRAVARSANNVGFVVENEIVEIKGVCPHCQGA